ncbi:hypothetical protein RvY_06400 [Ramazzottius varieornatus]|uniref:Uncharacterized protein n=1 Tax=Ramazzottius varieornatus TaxID=947166 RepID=A0A1D1V3X8_RAMVA|nr:hypothetical protein RvY_06400 [Ramazzottius varieornatus]
MLSKGALDNIAAAYKTARKVEPSLPQKAVQSRKLSISFASLWKLGRKLSIDCEYSPTKCGLHVGVAK